jgi:hypothetical protein
MRWRSYLASGISMRTNIKKTPCADSALNRRKARAKAKSKVHRDGISHWKEKTYRIYQYILSLKNQILIKKR